MLQTGIGGSRKRNGDFQGVSMGIFTKIEKNSYVDSLDTLFMMSVLNEQPGIQKAFVGLAAKSFKDTLAEEGMLLPKVEALKGSDFVIVACCDSQAAFEDGLAEIDRQYGEKAYKPKSYHSLNEALSTNMDANLCSIAVPGEYALQEVTNALNHGLHCVVFSNNVPLTDERKMKELAREKGLLCMGPDCGVANINGAALVLSSINNRGPFGICGASGTGIQHVAAILHECGSGVTQTIGTGGNDLKEPVGGIMMQMGIDALDHDPATKYIILISRKPANSVLLPILTRIKTCTKPVVVFFMGCDKELIESYGGIYAENLDDCGIKALQLIGKSYSVESDEEIASIVTEACKDMAPTQKYIRGLYTGGTYLDEAMRAMQGIIGPVWSNAPLDETHRLPCSTESIENTAVDFGEEEFTQGRPHPAIDPSIRKPFVLKEARDPEVAVIILDFILTPPGHMDPVGYLLNDILAAQEEARKGGRKLVIIGTVLGTDADFQNKHEQCQKLRDAGVLVAKSNYSAALIAAHIAEKLKER